MFCLTLHRQPPAPSLPHSQRHNLPVLQRGRVDAALIRPGWTRAGQIGVEPLLRPGEQHSKPLMAEQPALLLSAPRDPGAPTPALIPFPLCCSRRASRCSLRCYNLALPGISPVHPCEDNRVFKAETAKEYIQESMIKATILCTMEHPSRKYAELVPQNNYMCRVHCKHSFYVHQHSWGQCLKI